MILRTKITTLLYKVLTEGKVLASFYFILMLGNNLPRKREKYETRNRIFLDHSTSFTIPIS